ncbi:MAG TPA: type II secretion system protein GspG [Candidatus Omnitrophota bacterium]|nr:type II secretion system protein GspG [Candidatus Omnitrophota bacterium]
MKKKGFTILEILVVLAVLAILIGIAVPRIKGMQEQANITKAKAEVKNIQAAIESYYINKGSYPPNVPVGITAYILTESDIPQMLSGVLLDPFNPDGKEYVYFLHDNGIYYVLCSVGMDGLFGTKPEPDGSITRNGDGQDDICVTNGSGV